MWTSSSILYNVPIITRFEWLSTLYNSYPKTNRLLVYREMNESVLLMPILCAIIFIYSFIHHVDSVSIDTNHTVQTNDIQSLPSNIQIIDGDILVKRIPENVEAAAIYQFARRWPKNTDGQYVVPYELNQLKDVDIIKAVKWAMNYIQHGSNVVFRERHSGDTDYINCIHGNGCNSFVGRIGGEQPLSLGYGCGSRCVAAHELLHALGFMHEHQRTDRDLYLNTDVSELSDDWMYSVKFKAKDQLHTDYDIFSIMHYAINIQGHAVLNPKDLSKRPIALWRRTFLTSCDWNMLNTFYPGKMKPPKCVPGRIPDLLDPTPKMIRSFGKTKASWLCRYGNECFFDTGYCVLRNGKQIPDLDTEMNDPYITGWKVQSQQYSHTTLKNQSFLINNNELTPYDWIENI